MTQRYLLEELKSEPVIVTHMRHHHRPRTQIGHRDRHVVTNLVHKDIRRTHNHLHTERTTDTTSVDEGIAGR